MESDSSQVPPVVAVVVVHEPGDWFEETVASLAAQDYPNLRLLFLLADTSDPILAETERRIRSQAPDAFVRAVDGNPGYGPIANEVLQLVEGDSGFFLFCHDDVALERDVVRVLIEQLYRSNAGIVGPKLVEWDRPALLQHVGLGLDRFGAIDPVAEPEEYDQGQHDSVQEVFAVPSACVLVRADLFRTLGGFDPRVSFHGDDIDLCWRAHLSGARVMMVPTARVRHIQALGTRRPDLNHRALQARHRLRSVATLTGAAWLPLRLVQLVFLTVAEMVVGLFTGRFGEALAQARALVGLVPRAPLLIARRRAVKHLRLVPETRVQAQHARGSARLVSYLRSREAIVYVGVDSTVRRWRENSAVAAGAWIAVVLAVLVGSRSFFDTSVPQVGEFLPFPDSPRELWDGFMSGWNPTGFGETAPNPTGWLILVVLSVGTFFNMGLAHTLAVVSLVLVGIFGAGKVGTIFPSTRARIACFVVYGAVPLAAGLVARGEWTALVVYAAVPWFVHLLRAGAGIATADPRAAEIDLVDGVIPLAVRERVRYLAFAGLLAGAAAAFAPVVLPVLVAVGVVMALATLLAGASPRTAGWMVAGAVATGALGYVLNVPWSTTWTWEAMTPASTSGPAGLGLIEIASLGLGTQTFAVLAIGLYLPLVAAVATARAWRLTWAIRAAMLVVTFGAVAVLVDRGTIGIRLPDAAVLLVPVALGLAIGAGAALAAFDLDVRGADFGWRQPAGVVAATAIVIGVVPGVLALRDGAWSAPRSPVTALLEQRLAPEPDAGDGRVLFVGDPRALPVGGRELSDGIAYAIVDQGGLDVRQRWQVPDNEGDDRVREAFELMAGGETMRAGRLLGVLGIRYIVVPHLDEVASLDDAPLPVPAGLLNALDDQLDLTTLLSPPSFEIYGNEAVIPTSAVLTGATAEASELTAMTDLVLADLRGITPALAGAGRIEEVTGEVEEGTVHLGVPFDELWRLRLDDETVIEPRPGFGLTTAFDVGEATVATLEYETDGGRRASLVAMAAVWLLVGAAASRLTVPVGRRRMLGEDETILDLDQSGPDLSLDDMLAAEDPGGWISSVISEGQEPPSEGDAQRGGDQPADPAAPEAVTNGPGDPSGAGDPAHSDREGPA